NGYFSKTETTEDKLYSMVKSGIREFEYASNAGGYLMATSALAMYGSTRAGIRSLYQMLVDSVQKTASGETSNFVARLAEAADDEMIVQAGFPSDEAAFAEMDRLDQLDGMPMGENGDKIVIDGNILYYKVNPSPGNSMSRYLPPRTAIPP